MLIFCYGLAILEVNTLHKFLLFPFQKKRQNFNDTLHCITRNTVSYKQGTFAMCDLICFQKRSWMVWYTHITVQDCGPLVSKCLSSREFSDSPRKFGCRLFICGLSSTLLPYKNNSFHLKYGN